jgi:hypothetical protein
MSTTVPEENGMSVDQPTAFDLEALTEDESAIVGIVAQLRASGEVALLRTWAREGGEALDRVREALSVLGELDPRLLVEVALDGLIRAQFEDRSAVPRSC